MKYFLVIITGIMLFNMISPINSRQFIAETKNINDNFSLAFQNISLIQYNVEHN